MDLKKKQLKAIFAKKKNFDSKSIASIPTKSGVYGYFDKTGKLIYIGVAKKGKYANLRHRIESYKEKDNFDAHPTKKDLRQNIDKFSFAVVPIGQARHIERQFKNGTEFNKDHNIGTWKR